MKKLALVLLSVGLFGASPALAQQYRLPMELPTSGTQPYITAYRDHDGTTGLQDWNCKGKTYNGHKGTDIGIGSWPVMDSGSRWVVAAANGKVVFVNDGCFDRCSTGDCNCGSGYGNYVKLEHADGKTTYYGHLMKGSVAVGVGDQVKCGQHLGKVGSSGYSTGPHLHFEPRYASGVSDEPFSGPCGGPTSFWVSQGAYLALPSDTCENPTPPPVDDAALASETVPAGSTFAPGVSFEKSWTLTNTGNTTWSASESYSLAQVSGDAFGASPPFALSSGESVAPSAQKTWTVSFVAPATAGGYSADFRMDHGGTKFGATLTLSFVVEEPAPSGGGAGGTSSTGGATSGGATSGGSGGTSALTGGATGTGATQGQQSTKVVGDDMEGGCACRATRREAPPAGLWLLLLPLAAVRKRARKRVVNATLSRLDLDDVDLRESRINNADLSKLELTDANLSGARLTNVDLRKLRLEDATLAGARITNVDLSGVVIDDVKLDGLTIEGVRVDRLIAEHRAKSVRKKTR